VTSSLTTTRITPRAFYRIVAIAEAVTWTLLITGLLQKYVLDGGDLGVRIGGSIHGFVFLVYAATAVLVGINQRWRIGLIAVGVVTAVVPYATIPFDRWLEKNGKLEGGWRTAATDDPRDQVWIDRLMRWLLSHPALLSVLLVAGVVAVFSVLLILGPPGGRS
jgi:integral membrane protein